MTTAPCPSTTTIRPWTAPSAVVAATGADGRVRWHAFGQPRAVVTATTVDAVLPALRRVEEAVQAGATAVGFLCYEAAPAFDAALTVRDGCALPLLWFGVFDTETVWEALPPAPPVIPLDWQPATARADYDAAIAQVRAAIAAGATYQANYTMRLHAPCTGDAWPYFLAMQQAQRGDYGAYLDLGDHVIASASPELFLDLNGDILTCRPMKGTAARGLTTTEDDARAAALAACAKNRAENVMIVDMMRNDLGRIAETGSVRVPELFTVERYPTVWQLTSTVTARSTAGLPEIFAALFPCASITGAPKVETMRLLAALETAPRGIYTGAIGVVRPGRRALFNVAIRTMHVERATGVATYGVGGGVVWDSTPEGEYAECLTKTRVLTTVRPDVCLLETLAWRPGTGFALLDYHLRRLGDSARYFGLVCDSEAVAAALTAAARGFRGARRVRLLLDTAGMRIEDAPLPVPAAVPWRVALAPAPIDPADPWLYHKTTRRDVYEAARAACRGADDVLLWNPAGEVTESTLANVVARLDGRLVTPPVRCGLLPGTLRAHLLTTGAIQEAVLTRDDLRRVEALWLINSVRGWVAAVASATSPTEGTPSLATPTLIASGHSSGCSTL